MTARDFHLGDVLTATGGRMVSPNGLAGIRALASHLAGWTVGTHQLGRVIDACLPGLVAQHPALAGVVVPDTVRDEETGLAWLAEQTVIHGERLAVEPLPPGTCEWRDPIEEFFDRFGAHRVAVIDPERPESVGEAVDIIMQAIATTADDEGPVGP